MGPNESSRVTFEAENFQRSAPSSQPTTPKVVEWAIKYSGGYIKNEKQAAYTLTGFIVVAIALSLLLFFSGESGPQVPTGELYYGGPHAR